MEAKTIGANEYQLYPMGSPPKTKEQIEAERAAMRQFLLLKGLRLNIRHLGRLTGCIGYIGCTFTQENADKSTVAAIGYAVISAPGKLAGIVTSPIRGMYMCVTRTLLYTFDEVERVQKTLQDLIDRGTPQDCHAFRARRNQFIDDYGSSPLTTSKSSGSLIEEAKSKMPDKELAAKVRDYLAQTESPFSIICWDAAPHLTNQGKRLFNILMTKFIDFSLEPML